MSEKKEAKDSNSKGNKILIILLVATLLVVIGLAGFFGYYVFFKEKSTSAAQTKTVTVKAEETTVKLDEFIINLADSDKRYIKFNIYIAYTNANLADEITKKTPQICNAINFYIRSKKAADFDGIGLEKVQQELTDKINAVLENGKITNIYFHDIIIQ